MSTSSKTPSLVWRSLLAAAMVVALAAGGAGAENAKGKPMSYREAREFLARQTKLIELTNDDGARVAVCPQWQGRVMTSTCGGLEGPSFGFINRRFIEAGKPDARFNNYGGEERMWLSPEGGQFSLWFKPGVKQVLENWYTPAALNEGAWTVDEKSPGCRMTTTMKFQNASATSFLLDVTRTVRLLSAGDLRQLLGEGPAKLIGQNGVKMVAYETANEIANRDAAMTREKGLVSIWILGMLCASWGRWSRAITSARCRSSA